MAEILDFRPSGPAASKIFLIHNKRNEHLDFVLPSACGPFALRCTDKRCQTKFASNNHEHVPAAKHLHIGIPAKQFVQVHVEVKPAHLNGDGNSGQKDSSCTSGFFPYICSKFPSETGCIVAAGLSTWFTRRWPDVEQSARAFLKCHEVSDQAANIIIGQATEQLGEWLEAQPYAETDRDEYGDLVMAHYEGCDRSKTAPLCLQCPLYDPKPKPAATVDVDFECPAFQAVKLEFDGRKASVAKMNESGRDDKFQICGKWYDSRGKEVTHSVRTQDKPGSLTHDALGLPEPLGPQHKRDPMDTLRDAALAAAQTELGLSYLPDPGIAKGLYGDHKPLLPVLKEARVGQVGMGKAGQLGHNLAMIPHGLAKSDDRANSKLPEPEVQLG